MFVDQLKVGNLYTCKFESGSFPIINAYTKPSIEWGDPVDTLDLASGCPFLYLGEELRAPRPFLLSRWIMILYKDQIIYILNQQHNTYANYR